ncbi:MAG TPA: Tm-1-like ATP-binding domain-containing protein [Solirubrobacterales bacterium]
MESLMDLDFVRDSGQLDLAGPAVLVIATLDTKGEEVVFLANAIVEAGGAPVLLDSSVAAGSFEQPYPFVSREAVAAAAGSTIADVSALPRGEAVEKMQAGVRELAAELVSGGHVHGAICIGGAGAHLAGPAFQELEVGFPKMVVSPLASGQRQFEPYVGLRDVAVMHSVADIAGVNDITERVYGSAAGYITGAAAAHARHQSEGPGGEDERRTIAISMNGNTTKAMDRGRARLEGAGFAVVVFHANGVGGRALEDFVESGRASAVLDFTLTELGADLVGGLMKTGGHRMEAAGANGLPQVLVPGCVDFITCGPWAVAEAEFPGRPMFRHNPELTLVRLSAEEMAELGRIFAAKANGATGPTSILVPGRGLSVPDTEGGPFWDPETDAAFVAALREEIRDGIKVEVLDAHINDASFADAAVDELLALIAASEADGSGSAQSLAATGGSPAAEEGFGA